MADFFTVTPGWNVWSVYQVKDLDFSPLMVGVSRDRRLRIWVEDAVRLGAAGADVADAVDLKGGQVEILPGAGSVAGLKVAARKEGVSGPSLLVDGPDDLRYVRFFNRGQAAQLAWPHDDNYLVNEVFEPSANVAATQGSAPSTIGDTTLKPVIEGVGEAAGTVAKVGIAALAAFVLLKVLFRR